MPVLTSSTSSPASTPIATARPRLPSTSRAPSLPTTLVLPPGTGETLLSSRRTETVCRRRLSAARSEQRERGWLQSAKKADDQDKLLR